jgi:spore maturation protein CgeB
MQDTLHLFTASSGKQSARVIVPDDSTRHLHSTVKPEEEAKYFDDLACWGNVIIFTGFGLGYHVTNTIDRISPDTLIILVEYYDRLIETAISGLLENIPNTIVTISQTTWQKKIPDLTRALHKVANPQLQVIKHPASYAIHHEFYDSVLAAMYASLFGKSPSVATRNKILLLYGNFFLQEECRKAIEEITQRAPILFQYERIQSSYEYESNLQKIIQTEKPDYILSINMKGFDGNGILSTNASRFGIPLAVWFVDDPHPILLSHRKTISGDMYAFCWEKTYLPFLQKCGFTKTMFLPLATDPSLFSNHSPATPVIPLGFVGSSMGHRFLNDIRTKFLWTDTLHPLVQEASDALLKNPFENIAGIIAAVASRSGHALPFGDDRNITWLCSYTIHTASMKKRKQLINALEPLGIELFGDPDGWHDLLGSSIPLHPDVNYRTNLAATYRSIAVHINTTSCQMPTAVNQRVFDIPMTNSFVLSDNQEDMAELFEIRKEALCYNSIEELIDLVSFYRTNSPARNSICRNAQQRILHEHTYAHRLSSMLNSLK